MDTTLDVWGGFNTVTVWNPCVPCGHDVSTADAWRGVVELAQMFAHAQRPNTIDVGAAAEYATHPRCCAPDGQWNLDRLDRWLADAGYVRVQKWEGISYTGDHECGHTAWLVPADAPMYLTDLVGAPSPVWPLPDDHWRVGLRDVVNEEGFRELVRASSGTVFKLDASPADDPGDG